MLTIKEKENIIIRKSAEAKRYGRKVYIFGDGVGGKVVFSDLCENGIMPDGFCVDLKYYKADSSFCGVPVVPVDSIVGG